MRILFVSLASLFGGILSAFLIDCCIASIQHNASLFSPHSCRGCGHRLQAWDRVPVLSWLLNGGKCRFCGTRLSIREPILSSITILLWVASAYLWLPLGAGLTLTVMAAVSGLLCAAGLCWCDASENPILLPLLLCMGILGTVLPDGIELQSHLFGALGMLAFCVLMRYIPLYGRKGGNLRKDTVCYMGCIGLLMGWRSCFVLLPGAVVIGVLWSLSARKKQRSPARGKASENESADRCSDRAAISLCITGGGVIALFFGRMVMSGYLQLFSRIG